MNRNVFSHLPVHKAVLSYKRGVGIAANANRHARKDYLLKIDFTDFFPSLTDHDVRTVMEANADRFTPALSDDDLWVIVSTVCKNGALTIGAPSSPILSNAILYDFDQFVFNVSQKEQVTYSRYADDLFLSTNEPNRLSNLLELIRADLRGRQTPRLAINERKTVFTSRKRRRLVTGLVLTSVGTVSIGRGKKKHIRSLVNSYVHGNATPEEVSYLRGYLAFVKSVEPNFIDRMRKKYGNDAIDQLMLEQTTPRKHQ